MRMSGCISDTQMTKLPKYAQDEIRQLRSLTIALQEELVAQQQATPTHVQWGWACDGEATGYLKDSETIFFSTVVGGKRRDTIRVNMRREGDGLKINANGILMIECGAANDITVRIKP